MQRRDLLQITAVLGLASTYSGGAFAADTAGTAGAEAKPLTPPASGRIPVAFLLGEHAVVIDFAGPWAVFEQVEIKGSSSPFELYTVAETSAPLHVGGTMQIIPNYTIDNAPPPKVLVIPATHRPSDAVIAWIRRVTAGTDVTMSVCSGAFILARTGLLSGKTATTYHGAFDEFAMTFPDITLKRGARFVESGNLATSGGLSSGMDLALRVVERYFGREVAQSTAYDLEYQGVGWMNPDSNSVYATRRLTNNGHPLCPVCQMEVDPAVAPKASYQGKEYYSCRDDHKKLFESAPERFSGGV